MERLLTTKDLQEFLQLDRITVYRMLDAGDLPGIKIGGQWRFPEKEVKEWLERHKVRKTDVEAIAAALSPSSLPDFLAGEALGQNLGQNLGLTDLVSTACLQNVQDGYAKAVGAASITVDLRGQPFTALSNACTFCEVGRTSEEFRRRCSLSWASIALVEEEQPELHYCHAGIGYAVAPVQVLGKRIGLLLAGQFWAEPPDPQQAKATARRLAAECGLNAEQLVRTIEAIPLFSPDRVSLVTRVLATIANTVSEMGLQGYMVRLKLKQIAQIVRTLQ